MEVDQMLRITAQDALWHEWWARTHSHTRSIITRTVNHIVLLNQRDPFLTWIILCPGCQDFGQRGVGEEPERRSVCSVREELCQSKVAGENSSIWLFLQQWRMIITRRIRAGATAVGAREKRKGRATWNCRDILILSVMEMSPLKIMMIGLYFITAIVSALILMCNSVQKYPLCHADITKATWSYRKRLSWMMVLLELGG